MSKKTFLYIFFIINFNLFLSSGFKKIGNYVSGGLNSVRKHVFPSEEEKIIKNKNNIIRFLLGKGFYNNFFKKDINLKKERKIFNEFLQSSEGFIKIKNDGTDLSLLEENKNNNDGYKVFKISELKIDDLLDENLDHDTYLKKMALKFYFEKKKEDFDNFLSFSKKKKFYDLSEMSPVINYKNLIYKNNFNFLKNVFILMGNNFSFLEETVDYDYKEDDLKNVLIYVLDYKIKEKNIEIEIESNSKSCTIKKENDKIDNQNDNQINQNLNNNNILNINLNQNDNQINQNLNNNNNILNNNQNENNNQINKNLNNNNNELNLGNQNKINLNDNNQIKNNNNKVFNIFKLKEGFINNFKRAKNKVWSKNKKKIKLENKKDENIGNINNNNLKKIYSLKDLKEFIEKKEYNQLEINNENNEEENLKRTALNYYIDKERVFFKKIYEAKRFREIKDYEKIKDGFRERKEKLAEDLIDFYVKKEYYSIYRYLDFHSRYIEFFNGNSDIMRTSNDSFFLYSNIFLGFDIYKNVKIENEDKDQPSKENYKKLSKFYNEYIFEFKDKNDHYIEKNLNRIYFLNELKKSKNDDFKEIYFYCKKNIDKVKEQILSKKNISNNDIGLYKEICSDILYILGYKSYNEYFIMGNDEKIYNINKKTIKKSIDNIFNKNKINIINYFLKKEPNKKISTFNNTKENEESVLNVFLYLHSYIELKKENEKLGFFENFIKNTASKIVIDSEKINNMTKIPLIESKKFQLDEILKVNKEKMKEVKAIFTDEELFILNKIIEKIKEVKNNNEKKFLYEVFFDLLFDNWFYRSILIAKSINKDSFSKYVRSDDVVDRNNVLRKKIEIFDNIMKIVLDVEEKNIKYEYSNIFYKNFDILKMKFDKGKHFLTRYKYLLTGGLTTIILIQQILNKDSRLKKGLRLLKDKDFIEEGLSKVKDLTKKLKGSKIGEVFPKIGAIFKVFSSEKNNGSVTK